MTQQDKELIDKISSYLSPGDFYVPKYLHVQIWKKSFPRESDFV